MPLAVAVHRRRFLLATAALAACSSATVQPSSPAPAGSAQTVAVQVSPDAAQIAPGAAVQLAATVTGTANASVTWSVDEASGGAVTSGGLYTAPSTAGAFHVRATSAADATKSGVSTMTVSAPMTVAVAVSPATGAISACKTIQLSATVTGTTNTSVAWTVQEGAAGGTVTAAGLYTAPSGPGTYHVVATSAADPTKSALAAITVSEQIVAVVVSPATVTLTPGGSAQFTATVTSSCGTYTATSTLLSDGRVIAN